jgi:hypothetical protein
MNPYKDLQKDENFIIREFSDSIDPTELKWHRDLKNREIESQNETDWLLQLENKLPVKITNNFIPAKEWHRIIKGTGNLIIKIKEW